MAIQLQYVTPASGALASYHVVQTVQIDYVGSNTITQVASYVDANAYKAGKVPVYIQSISLGGIPDTTQDPLVTVQSMLTQAAPTDGPAASAPNRYTFAGGTLVDMPATATATASDTATATPPASTSSTATASTGS